MASSPHADAASGVGARIVAALPQAQGFALAGGAALIVRGIVTRGTNDLDFFGASAADVNRLADALEDALVGEDFRVERIVNKPGFVRLEVFGPDDNTTVDLGTDARLQPAGLTRLGEAITAEELGADKLLALFSRAQARDFVDVAALANHFGGLDRLCELAAEKDPGFSRSVLAEMLGGYGRLSRQEFPLDDVAPPVGVRPSAIHYPATYGPGCGVSRSLLRDRRQMEQPSLGSAEATRLEIERRQVSAEVDV